MNTLSLDWRYGNIEIFCDDNIISDSIILYGEWAQNEIDFLFHISKNYQDTNLIFGGANIGIQTIAMSKFLSEANISIKGFEIHPQVCEILKNNLEINHCTNVTPYNVGLNDLNEEIEIPKLIENAIQNIGAFSLHKKYSSAESVLVSLNTLDSLELESCSLIHLDVERHELSCLKGAINTIDKFSPDIYAEVLNYNHAKSLYEYLNKKYKYFYIHAPKAFNHNNFNKESSNIFQSNREYALFCSNKVINYDHLYPIRNAQNIEKIFNTFTNNRQFNQLENLQNNNRPLKKSKIKYNIQVFIDDGKGFTENNSIVHIINSRYSTLNFDLKHYSNIYRIRIDPNDNKCIIKIHNLSISNKNGLITLPISNTVNSYLEVDTYMLFDTNDPQIILNDINRYENVTALNIEIEYFTLNEDLLKIIFQKLQNENKVLKQQVGEEKESLDDHEFDLILKIDEIENVLSNFSPMLSKILDIEHNLLQLSDSLNATIASYNEQNKALNDGIIDIHSDLNNLNEKVENSESQIQNTIGQTEAVITEIRKNQLELESHLNKSFFARLFGNSQSKK